MPKHSKKNKKRSGRSSQLISLINSVVDKKMNKVGEIKYLDALIQQSAVNISSFNLMNACQNGNTQVTRIGISTKMKRLIMHLNFTSSAATAFARVVVFIDKASDGATFGLGSLFEAPIVYGATSFYYNSLFNHAQCETKPKRYQIIDDIAVDLSSDWYSMHAINRTIQLNGNTAYFDGANAGTIADISTGALYVLFLSNANNSSIILYGTLRYEFTDV